MSNTCSCAIAVKSSNSVHTNPSIFAGWWRPHAIVYVNFAVFSFESQLTLANRHFSRRVTVTVLAVSLQAIRGITERSLHSFRAKTSEIISRDFIYNKMRNSIRLKRRVMFYLLLPFLQVAPCLHGSFSHVTNFNTSHWSPT